MSADMRNIHSFSINRQITDVLQMIFVAEILSPSSRLWIVSPWISDIPIIDNESNQFITLETDWNRRRVTLSEIFIKLMETGTSLIIATRNDHNNNTIIDKLENYHKQHNNLKLKINRQDDLHEKGILGDHYYLSGSMNFTYNGVFINEENVLYHTNRATVAEQRVKYSQRWGGY